jgi:hypothetical protein
MKASFQRFPKQKPDDFSSGYAGFAVRTGLEPATLGVTGRYSNQLNYRTNTLCGAKIIIFSLYGIIKVRIKIIHVCQDSSPLLSM